MYPTLNSEESPEKPERPEPSLFDKFLRNIGRNIEDHTTTGDLLAVLGTQLEGIRESLRELLSFQQTATFQDPYASYINPVRFTDSLSLNIGVSESENTKQGYLLTDYANLKPLIQQITVSNVSRDRLHTQIWLNETASGGIWINLKPFETRNVLQYPYAWVKDPNGLRCNFTRWVDYTLPNDVQGCTVYYWVLGICESQ